MTRPRRTPHHPLALYAFAAVLAALTLAWLIHTDPIGRAAHDAATAGEYQ